ncbi:GDSL-type esterase/lipase family protein [Microbacterium sp. B2969]|uniref:GDSL-type esterase/lipase family protein n=1 Tax=Microbacterium alkaliflavum TaxID=3248839 RepID=A0ABW7Q222_9MICO
MRTSTRTRRAFATMLAGAVLVAGSLLGASSATAAPALPAKMAALGDSITQGTMTCSALFSCPTNSWSTGTTASVNSHASRLRAAGATLQTFNDSVVSSTSAALPGQATKAVGQGAQYVTILIGANDACTKTVAGMTSTTVYQTNVQTALNTLAASGAQIFVASIPNLLRMYDLNKASLSARFAWASLQVCQSLLANPTSTAAADVDRRNQVQQRVNEYNAVLATLCGVTPNCRFDGNAIATYPFTRNDISTRDYFHPSLAGQATIAAVTWPKTQWAS